MKTDTILITGGATGIGFAPAEAFLDKGHTVILCGRREHTLREAQKKRPALRVKVCDATDASGRDG